MTVRVRRVPRWTVAGALVLATALTGGCRDSTGPADALDVRRESSHGVYYMADGDQVDIEWQETYYAWLFDRFGVEPPGPLVYFKYRDREHMEEVTGRVTNGFAEIGNLRFHSIWPTDNHECVHALLSATIGLAPALFNEGVAVAHQTNPPRGIMEPRWSGTAIDEIAAQRKQEGAIPPLTELLDNPDFRRYSDQLTYPLAGSFVKHLIERDGYGPLKAVFELSEFRDPPDRLRAVFQTVYDQSLEAAWEEWLASL